MKVAFYEYWLVIESVLEVSNVTVTNMPLAYSTVVNYLAILSYCQSKVMYQHISILCVVEVANKSIQSIWNHWYFIE